MIEQYIIDELKEVFEQYVIIEPPTYYVVTDLNGEPLGEIEPMFDGRWQLRVDGEFRCVIG
jgi:hypothetical protein